MSLPPQQLLVELDQPGRYSLQGDVRFAGLEVVPGTQTTRIRFSRGSAIVLDVLLSEEALADVVRGLVPLHGIRAEDLPEALAHLRARGATEEGR